MISVHSFVLQPSDEDSLSLNIPMSHITEEEGMSKDDSSEHISSLTGQHKHTHTHTSVTLTLCCHTEETRQHRDLSVGWYFLNWKKHSQIYFYSLHFPNIRKLSDVFNRQFSSFQFKVQNKKIAPREIFLPFLFHNLTNRLYFSLTTTSCWLYRCRVCVSIWAVELHSRTAAAPQITV